MACVSFLQQMQSVTAGVRIDRIFTIKTALQKRDRVKIVKNFVHKSAKIIINIFQNPSELKKLLVNRCEELVIKI
jgi:hypothetical protein